jgi:RimJ/RimL family protein N-acetyltransferase
MTDIEAGGLDIVLAREADLPAIQALFEGDPGYFLLVQGTPPDASEARSLIRELPDGKSYADKFVYTVRRDGELLGVIDLIRDYPDPGTWFLGLIFLSCAARGTGLAAHLIDALRAHVVAEGGQVMRLAVVRPNRRARTLYDRVGFAFVYSVERVLRPDFRVDVDVMELRL